MATYGNYFGRLSPNPDDMISVVSGGQRAPRGVAGQVSNFQAAQNAAVQRQADYQREAQQLAAQFKSDAEAEATRAEQRARQAANTALSERQSELQQAQWRQSLDNNNRQAAEQIENARQKEAYNQAQLEYQRSQLSKGAYVGGQQGGQQRATFTNREPVQLGNTMANQSRVRDLSLQGNYDNLNSYGTQNQVSQMLGLGWEYYPDQGVWYNARPDRGRLSNWGIASGPTGATITNSEANQLLSNYNEPAPFYQQPAVGWMDMTSFVPSYQMPQSQGIGYQMAGYQPLQRGGRFSR